MAELIEEINKLPLDDQERILSQLEESFIPIEIDNTVYMIPEEVNNLIDSLSSQLKEAVSAISKN